MTAQLLAELAPNSNFRAEVISIIVAQASFVRSQMRAGPFVEWMAGRMYRNKMKLFPRLAKAKIEVIPIASKTRNRRAG